jgi:hypothetical protein
LRKYCLMQKGSTGVMGVEGHISEWRGNRRLAGEIIVLIVA